MKTFIYHLLLSISLILSLSSTPLAAELETTTATQREVAREFRLDGVIEAIKQSTVSAQTQGRVEEILFDVDDFVKKDQLLIKLKDTEQKARLHQAEADLKETNARLREAEEEFNRVQGMHSKKLTSQSQMDKAMAALKSARARQQAARAGIVQATEQLAYTRIKAPYSGILTHRHVEEGEIASPGQKLMSGLSLDQLRVNVDVPQSLISTIRKLGKARVLLPGSGFIEAVKLTIFPFANSGSNTFQVRIDLPTGIPDLFPGMFVKSAFVTGVKNELVVPRQAVVYRSEVTALYVVDDKGGIHFRYIRPGHPTENGMISVIAGLSAGEKIALDPIAAGALLKQQMTGTDDE